MPSTTLDIRAEQRHRATFLAPTRLRDARRLGGEVLPLREYHRGFNEIRDGLIGHAAIVKPELRKIVAGNDGVGAIEIINPLPVSIRMYCNEGIATLLLLEGTWATPYQGQFQNQQPEAVA